MGFQVCGVDHDALGPWTFTGHCRKEAVEHAKPAPAYETDIERFVRPVIFWCILPLQTMLDDVDNAVDDTAIINGRKAMCQRKVRRYPSRMAPAQQNKLLITIFLYAASLSLTL